MSLLRVQEIEILSPAGKAGVPIGHPYLQLPGMPEPSEIYTGTWENVSADYAGDFFRVEGGEALAFDASNVTEQLDAIRNIVGEAGSIRKYSNGSSGVFADVGGPATAPSWSGSSYTGAFYFDASTVVPTAADNRPLNRTIRVWKRIS